MIGGVKVEKIKLGNKQTFEILPMGISTNVFEKTRTFSFISDLGYSEVEIAFQPENTSQIEYYSIADELLKIYADCAALKSLIRIGKEYEDGKLLTCILWFRTT